MSEPTTVEEVVETAPVDSGNAGTTVDAQTSTEVNQASQPDSRDMELAALKGQVEALAALVGTRPAQAQDHTIDESKLEDEWNANPANGIKSVINMMADRDRTFQQELQRQKLEFEDRLAEQSPEYAKYASQIKAIDDMPVAKIMTKSEKLEMARRMSPASPQRPVAKAPGAVGGSGRVSIQDNKPVDRLEKFKPWLQASGALAQPRAWNDFIFTRA